jgi:hypothetical protein
MLCRISFEQVLCTALVSCVHGVESVGMQFWVRCLLKPVLLLRSLYPNVLLLLLVLLPAEADGPGACSEPEGED